MGRQMVEIKWVKELPCSNFRVHCLEILEEIQPHEVIIEAIREIATVNWPDNRDWSVDRVTAATMQVWWEIQNVQH